MAVRKKKSGRPVNGKRVALASQIADRVTSAIEMVGGPSSEVGKAAKEYTHFGARVPTGTVAAPGDLGAQAQRLQQELLGGAKTGAEVLAVLRKRYVPVDQGGLRRYATAIAGALSARPMTAEHLEFRDLALPKLEAALDRLEELPSFATGANVVKAEAQRHLVEGHFRALHSSWAGGDLDVDQPNLKALPDAIDRLDTMFKLAPDSSDTMERRSTRMKALAAWRTLKVTVSELRQDLDEFQEAAKADPVAIIALRLAALLEDLDDLESLCDHLGFGADERRLEELPDTTLDICVVSARQFCSDARGFLADGVVSAKNELLGTPAETLLKKFEAVRGAMSKRNAPYNATSIADCLTSVENHLKEIKRRADEVQ